jgi:hypothetical protein
MVSRPISAVLLACAVLILVSPLLGRFNQWRTRAISGAE